MSAEPVTAGGVAATVPARRGRPPLNLMSPFRIGFVGTLGALVAYGLAQAIIQARSVLVLLVVTMFIAFGLNPMVEFLMRRKFRRGFGGGAGLRRVGRSTWPGGLRCCAGLHRADQQPGHVGSYYPAGSAPQPRDPGLRRRLGHHSADGATIGAVVVCVVAFVDSPTVGIAAVIFYVAYQQFENYVLQPRVFKEAVDIPGALVVIAALIGGALLGVVGALLAVPVAAALLLLLREVAQPRLDTG